MHKCMRYECRERAKKRGCNLKGGMEIAPLPWKLGNTVPFLSPVPTISPALEMLCKSQDVISPPHKHLHIFPYTALLKQD